MSNELKGSEINSLSINRVSTGLVSLTKDHFCEGVNVFERMENGTYDHNKLDQIINDFPKFETVFLLTIEVTFFFFYYNSQFYILIYT